MGESQDHLNIALIGAGNLATNLGLALSKAGHNIIYVYSRTEESASLLGKRLQCHYTTDIQEASTLSRQCHVVILSVKDTVLSTLADTMPMDTDTLFLHTAGSMHIDTLKMIHRGVIYPMQTFSKSREAYFRVIPTFLEVANEADHDKLDRLAHSITESVYWLPSDKRKLLHLSAVFACNFANYCYDVASEILAQEDIPFSVMLPLIQETTSKLQQLTPFEAQTGPAVRYDTNVIERHLDMLSDDNDKQQLYAFISQLIHKRHEL